MTDTDTAPAGLDALRRLAEIARSQYAGIDGSVIWDIEIVGGPECCGNALPSGECCGNPRDGREQQQVQIGGGPDALLEFLDAAVEAMPALLDELERARADSRRLDWLDNRNRGLNAYCGTTYHWKLTLSHLVTRLSVKFPDGVDLHDSEPHGFKSCREAIDAEMRRIAQVRKEPHHDSD